MRPLMSGLYVLGFLYLLHSFSALAHRAGDECAPALLEKFLPVQEAVLLERFDLNPDEMYVGFARAADGKIRHFKDTGRRTRNTRVIAPLLESKRRLDYLQMSGVVGYWNKLRQVTLIPLVPWPNSKGLKEFQFRPGKGWSALPLSFKDVFSQNKIWSTSSDSAVLSEFAVLMAVNPVPDITTIAGQIKGELQGRSGVLMKRASNGRFIPVVLQDAVTGLEYLFEIKGVGAPDGEFRSSDNLLLRGGLTHDEGLREYSIIRREEKKPIRAGGVLGGGYIDFNLDASTLSQQKQGYLFRLTPSSIRLSYENPASLPQMSNISRLAVPALGKLWAEFFSRGLIPLTHPENILVSAEGDDFWMTDFADLFDGESFPRDLEGRRHTKRDAFLASLDIIFQLAQYRSPEDFFLFRRHLLESLHSKGMLSPDQVQALQKDENLLYREPYFKKKLWDALFGPSNVNSENASTINQNQINQSRD